MKSLFPGKSLFIISVLTCCLAAAQSVTSRLAGTVKDPQGAVIAGAEVAVRNLSNGQSFAATADVRGEWVLPQVPVGTYRVSISHAGFRTKVIDDVVTNAGVPATVNASLEVGTVAESVEVSAGAEVLQTTTAAVSNTISGRQIVELPYVARNSLELLVTQPGTQTPTNGRSSTVNGLPRGALNITMDGMNVQDNLLKSSDGFFAYIYPSQDSIEEITLTSSASGVDSTSQGAAQIKLVTRGGTNAFHGGTFWQHRNTFFNANSFYNNQAGSARDIIKLNQGGVHVGGPIKKNKAFFFFNYEIYKLPATKQYTRTILTDSARQGIFTYAASSAVAAQGIKVGDIQKVDLYKLAAAGNAALPASVRPFQTTADPILAQTFSAIAAASAKGIVSSNVNTNNDYNRQTLTYSPNGKQDRKFFTSRLDYNITSKHTLTFVYNYDKYNSLPDFLNNVVPAFPGEGTVLGTQIATGQLSNRFAGSIALRSTLSPTLTNEFRTGLNSGTVLFFPDVGSSSVFSAWKGYAPSFNSYLSNVYTTNNSSRRNSPVKEFGDTVSWVKGRHQFSLGGNFDQVNTWQQTIGNNVIPTITFAVATNDPVNTGSTGIFTNANFPGSSTSDQSNAAALYAVLTGRVSSIGRSVALGEDSHTYGNNSLIDRNRIREFGLFATDTWKVLPNLTVNLGLRYEKQLPFVNISGTYTRVGDAGLWGVSGIGNLFKPGTLAGTPTPGYLATTGGEGNYSLPAVWAPGIGIAYQVPGKDGFLGWLLGNKAGATVVRLGYSIATIREGGNVFINIYGSNQGGTLTASVSNSATPTDFGPAGSVSFRDASFPVKSGLPNAPTYPIPINANTNSLNDFASDFKMGYVQSWNVGIQRQFGNNALEVRYTGNHGLKEWRQYNINEVNIVESGFLNEFKIAQANLALARKTTPTSNTFGGLAGMAPIPILAGALGVTSGAVTDSTIAANLALGQAGTTANAIATNTTRMANLTKLGYPSNLFQANPAVSSGGSFLLATAALRSTTPCSSSCVAG